MHDSLFSSMVKNFTIARVTKQDVVQKTDVWHDLHTLILNSESMYPKIGKWVDNKIAPALGSGSRSAFVGYFEGLPIVSAVVKGGDRAKFCHLKVAEAFQRSHIGEIFFALMAMEIRNTAKEVHFTLPEGLWEEKKKFFSSFAFRRAEKSEKQYRLFENELHCSAPFDLVWRSVVQKLPKLRASIHIDNCSNDPELLLSLRPNNAEAILRGTKTVEIRRFFSHRWTGSRVTLYASAPTSSVVGEAVIQQTVQLPPESIWERFSDSIGCTREEFDQYSHGAQKVFALLLTEVRQYPTALPLRVARTLVNSRLQPPQNYSALRPDSPWSQAMPLVSIFQPSSGFAAV